VADLGETPLFWVKKKTKGGEGRKAGRARKKKPSLPPPPYLKVWSRH